ncbi:hypothetical protein SAMN05444161_4741 [Rhizobiales bacterium GAS191]|nr:hypothetical protein SAMN05444161_4741 [Rhizobiales bacterium GAS191]
MGTVKIPYYTTRKRHGKVLGYWQPSKTMRQAGFALVSCGPDGPDAWRKAKEWSDRWQAYRVKLEAPEQRRWPPGSIGDAFDRYRATETWARKPIRTREDWDRGWARIEKFFGDCDPATVTLETLDEWYAALLEHIGVREAHRAMKIWRALWQVCGALKLCNPANDPSKGIRRVTPVGRTATWREGEIVRLVKGAWRQGYRGLAVVVAIAWDTGFSPVDARRLSKGDVSEEGFRIPRAKTGKPAIGTICNRTRRLMGAYLEDAPETLADAPLFRNRSGAAYSKDTLGDDFRAVRAVVFPGDDRKLMDARRSASTEALAGGATAEQVGSKMANSIATNRDLERTYFPVSNAVVKIVDGARLAGRRAIRGTKV